MDLEDHVGGARQNRVGAQRGDDLIDRSDMRVGGTDQIVERLAVEYVACTLQCRCRALQASFGMAARHCPVIGDKERAGGDDARCKLPWTRREIGIDDRMLDIGERRARCFSRTRLRTRKHETIAGLPCPPAAIAGECGLPDAFGQGMRCRIENGVTGERRAGQRGAQRRQVTLEDGRAVGAVMAEGDE